MAALADLLGPADAGNLLGPHDGDVCLVDPSFSLGRRRELHTDLVQGIEGAAHERIGDTEEQPAGAREVECSLQPVGARGLLGLLLGVLTLLADQSPLREELSLGRGEEQRPGQVVLAGRGSGQGDHPAILEKGRVPPGFPTRDLVGARTNPGSVHRKHGLRDVAVSASVAPGINRSSAELHERIPEFAGLSSGLPAFALVSPRACSQARLSPLLLSGQKQEPDLTTGAWQDPRPGARRTAPVRQPVHVLNAVPDRDYYATCAAS